MKKMTVAIFGALAIGIVWVLLGSTSGSAMLEGDGVVYKSGSCGCCGVWAGYIEDQGLNAQVLNTEALAAKKDELNIPAQLRSCHTTTIGKYYVEGHIPAQAVQKLLDEQPDIAGIAMPGMPSGSPGMPGSKQGDFVIYAVNHNGSYEEFMRI